MIKIYLVFLLTTLSLFGLSKEERIIRASLSPYTVKNITYYPHKLSVGEEKDILASWYGEYFHGRLTALGEVYDMNGYTAAHKTYPLGTILKVTNPKNGISLKVRINDRGPFWGERELDLSKGSATFLRTKEKGVAPVHIEVVFVPKIARSSAPVMERKAKIVALHELSTSNIIIASYAYIEPNETNVPVLIGRFSTLKKARAYEKAIKKYFALSYVLKFNGFYRIKSYLPANEKKTRVLLKRLKRYGLIKSFGVYWSYK